MTDEAKIEAMARATVDPGDGTVQPDLKYVLIRGFHAMGWERPADATIDMLRAALSALSGLSPREEAGEPVAWLVKFNRANDGIPDSLVVRKRDDAEREVFAPLIQSVAPLYASPSPPKEAAQPFDRETLGRMVREAWVRWAQTQPNPKPSWLAPYDDLSEADKEADRQIGEVVARWTIIGLNARNGSPINDPPKEAAKDMVIVPRDLLHDMSEFLHREGMSEQGKYLDDFLAAASPSAVDVPGDLAQARAEIERLTLEVAEEPPPVREDNQ